MTSLKQKNVLTAARSSGSDDMIDLYTLPTCPVCEMIKKALDEKHLVYEVRDLGECTYMKVDRAPVMVVSGNLDLSTDPISADAEILTSPIKMMEWIKKQE